MPQQRKKKPTKKKSPLQVFKERLNEARVIYQDYINHNRHHFGPYAHGLANGYERIVAIMEGRDFIVIDPPCKWADQNQVGAGEFVRMKNSIQSMKVGCMEDFKAIGKESYASMYNALERALAILERRDPVIFMKPEIDKIIANYKPIPTIPSKAEEDLKQAYDKNREMSIQLEKLKEENRGLRAYQERAMNQVMQPKPKLPPYAVAEDFISEHSGREDFHLIVAGIIDRSLGDKEREVLIANETATLAKLKFEQLARVARPAKTA